MASYTPKYHTNQVMYMGFLSNNHDHHGNEWHYTVPTIELTQSRVCPNGGTESIRRILPLGFNNTIDPFYLAPFGVPCSVPPPVFGPGFVDGTSTVSSSSSGGKFNPVESGSKKAILAPEYGESGTCGVNENGVSYTYGGGPCCPAPLEPLGHKIYHARDFNGPAISADVHHYYNNLGCPYNDDDSLNGWGTSVITNNSYDCVVNDCDGVYQDSVEKYRSGHFLVVLERARRGETPHYDDIEPAEDGKKYVLSINGVQGRHIYLQRGRRYYFTFKSKIGKDCECDDEINESDFNNIIFTNSKKGGPDAALLFGTMPIPSGTTAWLRVPREFPSTFFLQSSMFKYGGTVVNIDRYGPGHGYHY